MVTVRIKDYERDEIVGTVSDQRGLETDDRFLHEVVSEMSSKGDDEYALNLLVPGEKAGEYKQLQLEPGDTGYARSLIDKLPSPFDIADLEQLDELPIPGEDVR